MVVLLSNSGVRGSGSESGSGSECTYTESLFFECKALRGSVALLRSDVLKTCVH